MIKSMIINCLKEHSERLEREHLAFSHEYEEIYKSSDIRMVILRTFMLNNNKDYKMEIIAIERGITTDPFLECWDKILKFLLKAGVEDRSRKNQKIIL